VPRAPGTPPGRRGINRKRGPKASKDPHGWPKKYTRHPIDNQESRNTQEIRKAPRRQPSITMESRRGAKQTRKRSTHHPKACPKTNQKIHKDPQKSPKDRPKEPSGPPLGTQEAPREPGCKNIKTSTVFYDLLGTLRGSGAHAIRACLCIPDA